MADEDVERFVLLGCWHRRISRINLKRSCLEVLTRVDEHPNSPWTSESIHLTPEEFDMLLISTPSFPLNLRNLRE